MVVTVARNAVKTLKTYVKAKEASIGLEDEMATAIHRLLEAIALEDWDVAMVFDEYTVWLEEG